MKATASAHSSRIDEDCPVLDGTAIAQYRAAMKAANELSLAMLAFLQKKTPEQQTGWIRTSVSASQALFQPWGPELLYTLAALGRARFTGLQSLLGLSSRTLSDKLKSLRDEGLVDREVFDEQPVRIEYFLTKHGRWTAAAATPLFTHLAHETLTRRNEAHAPAARS